MKTPSFNPTLPLITKGATSKEAIEPLTKSRKDIKAYICVGFHALFSWPDQNSTCFKILSKIQSFFIESQSPLQVPVRLLFFFFFTFVSFFFFFFSTSINIYIKAETSCRVHEVLPCGTLYEYFSFSLSPPIFLSMISLSHINAKN